MICTDTLERGRNHEIQLIGEIYRILQNGGMGIFDFHNFRPRFKGSVRPINYYTEKEIKKLLKGLNINDFKIYPFGYFPTRFAPSELAYLLLDRIFKFFVPPIRYLVVIKK